MDKQHNPDEQSSLMSDNVAHECIKVQSKAVQQLPTVSCDNGSNASKDHAFSLPVNPTNIHTRRNPFSTWGQGSVYNKKEENILAFIFVILLLLLCNIGILCSKAMIFKETDKNNFALVNGDRVRKCPEKEYDGNCFEVTDIENHVIYRTDNDKRILNFFQCSFSAPQTEWHKCLGEYAFSHNSSIVWFHRLYYDSNDS